MSSLSIRLSVVLLALSLGCTKDEKPEDHGSDAGASSDGPASGYGSVSGEDAAPALPPPVKMMVPPEGGEVKAEGVALTIPSGALQGATEITATPLEEPTEAVVAASRFVEFSPAGLTFVKPVTVRFDLSRDPMPGDPPIVIYWSNADGTSEELPARIEGRQAVAEVAHFSEGGAIFQIPTPKCGAIKCPPYRFRCECFGPFPDGTGETTICPTNFDKDGTCPGGTADRFEGVNGKECSGYLWFEGKSYAAKGKLNVCKKIEEGAEDDCVVRIYRSDTPESAAHIEDAQRDGRPEWLSIDRKGAKSRRAMSIAASGLSAVPGKERDEYPPAMFSENGGRADVRLIDARDNSRSGVCIRNQLIRVKDFDSADPSSRKVRIVVVE